MSNPNKDSDSSYKRRSLFGRTPLSAFSPIPSRSNSGERDSANVLKKRRTVSSIGSSSGGLEDGDSSNLFRQSPDFTTRPQFSSKGSGGRPTSLMGSWKLTRSAVGPDEPKSTTSTKAPSVNWGEPVEALAKSRNVLFHGEVITRSTMLSKKTEYLVLTETHLVRFKSVHKAAETFSGVIPNGRSSRRHSQSPSVGSSHEFQYAPSEASGDRLEGMPLRQFVAVYQLDDGRPYFAIEIACLDDDTNHASVMTLQFATPEEMSAWLQAIRTAANQARLSEGTPISQNNCILAARVVERDRDYEPPNYAIYKVVQRPAGKAGTRASSDDLAKMANTVCFLAIGVHKVHLIPLFKSTPRGSTPSLGAYNEQSSYGILTLTSLRMNDNDDNFELTFRCPMKRPKVLNLASLASHDIAVRLRSVEVRLRPEWESRPYLFKVPDEVKNEILRDTSPQITDPLDYFDRVLVAYCVAYGVNPANIRYQINHPEEDGPCFELLGPADPRKPAYGVYELLSIMRALRYLEYFASMSFADVSLDALNDIYDSHGQEHLCTKTKRGTPIQMDYDTLARSSILVQEVRAMVVTNKKVRRMDFTSCITRDPHGPAEANDGRDVGCGIVEAIFPLCIHNTTNVDWITLNNIQLGETDLDYIIQAIVERQCHFRALGLSNCGLTDRTLGLLLESLRPQENTLEALDLSRNLARITPSSFDSQIGVFGFLRKLNLSNVSRTSGSEPLIFSETLLVWKLQELILTGTALNPASVDAIAAYVAHHKQSRSLRELRLDRTYLSGKEIAVILQSLTETPGQARDLHLDISENNIEQGLAQFTKAIAGGYAPRSLSIREIEFEDEGAFRKLVMAVAANTTITHLDISRASLPCDASEETCHALANMFVENKTLEYLDLSGEESRLETSKLGVGINKALHGLKNNTSLRVLRIPYQKLGLQGASTLADVLKANTGLVELHCENNGIPLSGFTDIVNSLHRNTTILYVPPMTESKQLALKQTEAEIKQVRDSHPQAGMPKATSVRSKLAHRVSMGAYSKDKAATPPMLSDQDIRAALSLVDESWSRQVYRLHAYLQRNRDIAEGIPTTMEIDEEEFERPDSGAGSLSGMLEKVKLDSTPTAEKELDMSDSVVEKELAMSDDASEREAVMSDEVLEKQLEMKVSPRSARSPLTSPPTSPRTSA